jgi:hypothetical protein
MQMMHCPMMKQMHGGKMHGHMKHGGNMKCPMMGQMHRGKMQHRPAGMGGMH